MIAGFGVTLAYLVYTAPPPLGFGEGLIFGIQNISAGIFGIPIGFIVMIAVSYMTPEPSEEMQQLVDEVRRPSGGVIADRGRAAST